MPGFDFADFSKPLVDGICMYGDQMIGVPFDIPIFIMMYRKDLFDKHGLKAPTTMDEYMNVVKAIDEAERKNGTFGTTGQLKSGHYSLECDWTAWVWSMGGSVFGKDQMFSGGDAEGIEGLEYMLELVKHMPPAATTWTWDGEGQSAAQGTGRHPAFLGRVLPQLRRSQELEGRRPLRGGQPAHGEEAPDAGRGGLQRDPAYRPPGRLVDRAVEIFEEPGRRLDLHAMGHLEGRGGALLHAGRRRLAGARIRRSATPGSRPPPRSGPAQRGTSRPSNGRSTTPWARSRTCPSWAEMANNVIPVELGKLLAGQYGSAKECMAAIKPQADQLAQPFRKS